MNWKKRIFKLIKIDNDLTMHWISQRRLSTSTEPKGTGRRKICSSNLRVQNYEQPLIFLHSKYRVACETWSRSPGIRAGPLHRASSCRRGFFLFSLISLDGQRGCSKNDTMDVTKRVMGTGTGNKNPKIKIWILICCPYSFSTEVVRRSW